MNKQVALIHTSPSMVPVFKPLAAELLPAGMSVFNMIDESLLCDIIRDGKTPPATARRLVGHVLSAEQAGADFILVTCSSMGRAVEAAQALCGVKVMRVDDAMARNAVSIGPRIGVIATLPSTLEPTVALIQSQASAAGKTVNLTSRVVEGAFKAVIGGDGATHDKLVGDALRELARQVDVIVLAQASMARVVESIPQAERPIPILSSPRLAMEELARVIANG